MVLEDTATKGLHMHEHPVRTARRLRKMSAEKLAQAAGVSTATVYNIETGRSLGRVTTLVAIATVLDLVPSDLIQIIPAPADQS